jgi:hypothetical protein
MPITSGIFPIDVITSLIRSGFIGSFDVAGETQFLRYISKGESAISWCGVGVTSAFVGTQTVWVD